MTPPARRLWAARVPSPPAPDVTADLDRYRRWVRRREDERLSAPAPDRATMALDVVMVVRDPRPDLLDRALWSLGAQTATTWALHLAVVGGAVVGGAVVGGAVVGGAVVGGAVVGGAVVGGAVVGGAVVGEGTAGAPDRVDGRTGPAESGALAGREVRTSHLPAGTADEAALLAAASQGTAPGVVLVGQHDLLAPDALALLGGALSESDVAYGDEDLLGADGRPSRPALKGAWSPELLMSADYLGRPLAVRRDLLASLAGPGTAPAPAWSADLGGAEAFYDLALRIAEVTGRVTHVPEVICRHLAEEPPAGPEPARRALARRGEAGEVFPAPGGCGHHIRRPAPAGVTVTAIVPFRDQPTMLRACVESLQATARDAALELLLVDNGSEEPETATLLDRLAGRTRVTVISSPGPFNWARINTEAARHALGNVLLFCNNDVEALHPGWLDALAAQALRPEVGAVGARLVFPDGRLQHAGMILGLNGAAGHVLAGLDAAAPGYLGMAGLPRDCSAVTGACMATARAVFERLGGFDEMLGSDLNDVDYCLRARATGLRIVYEPQAELVHHESPSRGTSGRPADIVRFLERWESLVVAGDPYLSPHLTRVDGSCALAGQDEAADWARWRAGIEAAAAEMG